MKQIAELNRRGLLDQHMVPILKSNGKNFFSLPNELFFHEHRSRSHHGLRLSALLRGSPHTSVSSQLPHHLRCSTLDRVHCDEAHHEIGGQAVFITIENTSYIDKHGMKQNGNNLYTILPIQATMDHCYQQQMLRLEERQRWQQAQALLAQSTESAPVCPTVRRCVPSFGVWQSPCPTKGFQGRFGPLSEEISRTKEKSRIKARRRQRRLCRSHLPAVRAVSGVSVGAGNGVKIGEKTEF